MNHSLTLLIFFLVFNSFLLWFIFKNRGLLVMNLFLMFISPWIWTIILNAPTIPELSHTFPKNTTISDFVEQTVSWDYLFFHGSDQLFYAVGEHGYFLLSFLPLLIFGFWYLLRSSDQKQRLIVTAFATLLMLALFASKFIGLLAAFLFVPNLSIVAAIGLFRLITLFSQKRTPLTVKLLVIANIFWIAYEALRLLRVIQVRQLLQL